MVRPDIIVERVSGLHLFSGETDRGRQWLESRAATDRHQRLGKSLGVDDEDDARDLADAAMANSLDVME
jgi:pyrroloquinoline quinone (PQQ) biosynthesis protein C